MASHARPWSQHVHSGKLKLSCSFLGLTAKCITNFPCRRKATAPGTEESCVLQILNDEIRSKSDQTGTWYGKSMQIIPVSGHSTVTLPGICHRVWHLLSLNGLMTYRSSPYRRIDTNNVRNGTHGRLAHYPRLIAVYDW